MWSVMRRRKVGAASETPKKLHGRMIQLLYGHRSGNVTHLGTYYKSSYGRRLRGPR